MDEMRRPHLAPRFARGPAIGASLLLLLVIIVAYAWIDGGAERVHAIAQPVTPERAA